jgi:two-component system, OmpR family, phosphate regulon sensor histidine kinase PhoR
MFFNSRAVAVLLAGVIALITSAFLSLVDSITQTALIVAAAMAFSSSFLLIYLTLEFLIFREINQIYQVLDKLKKKDFKLGKKKHKSSANPLKKLNQEIYSLASRKQDEIDELKKLEIYRREFLADVSHELKTPIFAAQGFVHTLIDGAIDDRDVRDKFLEKAAKSLDGLDALVQDLITLSQMEIGVITMQYEHFDLYQLCLEVFEQLEKKSLRKNTTLHIEKKGDKSFVVEADRNRIRQVIINLVENAVKYGNEGGQITVSLSFDKDQVQVAVKDDGPGIPEEHLKRIFERFYRVEKSRSKDKGGSGLGLAIVKHIIEAHQSKVHVTSKLGKGTTFVFRLQRGKLSKATGKMQISTAKEEDEQHPEQAPQLNNSINP